MGAGPRSITIVSSHYHPHLGGVERYVGLQTKECVRLGFAVRIVTHDTERVGFLEEQPGMNIYRLRCWSPLAHNRLPFPVSLRELYRLAHALTSSSSELTIVHTRYFLLSVLGCLLARCSGSHLVLIDHSSDYIRLGARWLNGLCHVYEHFLTMVIMLFQPRVFGVARASATWLRRFGMRRVGVCYNGVDLAQRLDSPVPLSEIIGPMASKKVVLAVGRLLKEKGFMELVEGFERFAEKRDDYVLVIVGHGELEPHLRAAAQRNAKILFLGPRPLSMIMSLMSQATVLVNPSNYPEGLPTILLEAGLCGLAVISTPSGGAAEIIADGETGILIERGEAARVDDALRMLDTTLGLRERIARNLRVRIEENFSFAVLIERFLFQDLGLPR